MKIKLKFDGTECSGRFFDTSTSRVIYSALPLEVSLTSWGREFYGEIPVKVKEENLTGSIPSGGIAYTSRGNLLCIFFGQRPAWDVEHIGEIEGSDIQKLIDNPKQNKVLVERD